MVIPLYNEEENLPSLHRRLTEALGGLVDYELILVNDGSRDATPELLDRIAREDRRVAAVHLSRNFGHQAAICAGIDLARGDAVVLMDGDLQDPPESLPRFLDKWREGYDVVFAVRRKRKEPPHKRLGYFLFYRIFRAISELDIPLDSGDFCLMDRRVVEVLRDLPEKRRFVRGLRTFVGFRQIGLEYERAAREAGRPKYTLRGLVRLAIDGLVSFSDYPLRLVTHLGLITAAVAVGLLAWSLADALFNQTAPRGWASMIVVVLFLGAVQLVCLGIVGEYVRLIFQETKRRPTYVVARVAGTAIPEQPDLRARRRARLVVEDAGEAPDSPPAAPSPT